MRRVSDVIATGRAAHLAIAADPPSTVPSPPAFDQAAASAHVSLASPPPLAELCGARRMRVHGEAPASTPRSSPDAPDVCRRRRRDTTPERSVYSRQRRGTIPPSDPVLHRPARRRRSRAPPPPIDEAGDGEESRSRWERARSVGARGVDARNLYAARARYTHASSDPECAFTDDAVARRPVAWRRRRLRTSAVLANGVPACTGLGGQ